MTSPEAPGAASTEPRARGTRWRTWLLAIIALGASGLVVELLLLEHWVATPQWTPLVTLAVMLVATGVVARRPDRRTVGAYRWIMLWAVFAGLLGIGFHLRDNLLFEWEVAPDASLLAAAWHALRGATPLLAPGSLAQLGLLGLLFVYRHPALPSRNEPEIP